MVKLTVISTLLEGEDTILASGRGPPLQAGIVSPLNYQFIF